MSQGNRLNHPKMKQELFKNLPSEIVIDILSRLPVRTVISCKCVQKCWLHLVETQEFVKSHLSKSVPCLALAISDLSHHYVPNLYKFFEIEDGFDVEHHDHHYKLVTEFNLINGGKIMGSADGLLFLCKLSGTTPKPNVLYICNPITREFINLHCPQEFSRFHRQLAEYGFGSSKMTYQYKVVRIFHEWQKSSEAKCDVYTLGIGSWRRHASCDLLEYRGLRTGAFVNGNIEAAHILYKLQF
ncbi:hypothetical protein ACS0TY_035969 [Phlomoides rotata]